MSATPQGRRSASLGPDELVAGIASIIAGYRAEDGIRLDEDHVARWADQFERSHRLAVLRETHGILAQRYFTREDAMQFLDGIVQGLAQNHAGGDVRRMLATTQFLDLQPPGKSQPAMLALLDEITSAHGMRRACVLVPRRRHCSYSGKSLRSHSSDSVNARFTS